MCLRDLILTLFTEGRVVTEGQVRWAITSGKISRPPLDGSLRFDFGPEHLEQLRRLFNGKVEEAKKS
jgi:hypothetical protein